MKNVTWLSHEKLLGVRVLADGLDGVAPVGIPGGKIKLKVNRV